MAFKRSLSNRATLIARRYQPSFAYIVHEDDHKNHPLNEPQSRQKPGNFVRQRSFGTGFSNSSSGFGVLFQDRRCFQLSFLPSTGVSFCRYMSTTVNDGADKIEIMSDVAEVLKDTAVEAVASQAPAVNEVAVAAADCWLPVATLQYVIDAIHSFTGFNWWASIVVTTLLIRGATLPLLINQLRATTKMTLMRPRMEEIKAQMESKGGDSLSMAEGQNKMKKLFKEYGVTPFTPLKGLFIQGPIFVSFFLAISTMAEKMPSFKHGGAYWFTDLSTPDSLYILPVLTGLTFLITVECNMQEGMEGNPAAGTMKKVSRVLAFLTVPFTMNFPKVSALFRFLHILSHAISCQNNIKILPTRIGHLSLTSSYNPFALPTLTSRCTIFISFILQAIFCYWITSNLFSLTYGLVLKAPGVKKALGVPEIPKPPAGAAPPARPSIDLYSALKQSLKQARTVAQEPTSLPVEPTKASNQRTSSPSSSATCQRLRSLEKHVKGRKKNKKR